MGIRIFCLLFFSMIFTLCMGQQKKNREAVPAERYMTNGLFSDWESLDFSDSALVHSPVFIEQLVSESIDRLKELSPEKAASVVKGVMRKASTDSVLFVRLFDLYEKFLYSPNAPERDETLFVYVLEAVLEAPILDEVGKIRPAYLLEQALKNREGELAADFTYILNDGKKGTLYQTKADCLLIFFYDPDCHTCQDTMNRLATSPIILEWIRSSRLGVLAIYPDEDLEAWKKYVQYMPVGWINAYDSEQILKNEELYDLKVLPTLYLLDKDKKVLLKETTVGRVEKYLNGF